MGVGGWNRHSDSSFSEEDEEEEVGGTRQLSHRLDLNPPKASTRTETQAHGGLQRPLLVWERGCGREMSSNGC